MTQYKRLNALLRRTEIRSFISISFRFNKGFNSKTASLSLFIEKIIENPLTNPNALVSSYSISKRNLVTLSDKKANANPAR